MDDRPFSSRSQASVSHVSGSTKREPVLRRSRFARRGKAVLAKHEDAYLAKGKRGEVYLRNVEGKQLLVKVKNPKSEVDTIANEARFTKLLNKHGIGPRFHTYDAEEGELVREYIVGEELRKWLPAAEKEAVRKVLLVILNQCRTMDALGINKLEMTRPWKHIIIQADGKPFLIDFERCKETPLPKNVTQFCQFLTGSNMRKVYAEKGMTIDTARLLTLAKAYKDCIKADDHAGAARLHKEMQEVLNGD